MVFAQYGRPICTNVSIFVALVCFLGISAKFETLSESDVWCKMRNVVLFYLLEQYTAKHEYQYLLKLQANDNLVGRCQTMHDFHKLVF